MLLLKIPWYIVLSVFQVTRIIASMPLVIVAIGAHAAHDETFAAKLDRRIDKIVGY